MNRTNSYDNRLRMAERKYRQIIRYFSLDLSASDAARLAGISLRSVNTIDIKLRQRIAGTK